MKYKSKEKTTLNLSQIKNKIVRLLSKRDHTVMEIKLKIKQYNVFEQSDFDQALEWVKKLGYLIDEKILAQRWVTQWQKQGRSRRWISGKLKTKGLTSDDLFLSATDDNEAEAAKVFLTKKMRNKTVSELSFADKQKLMGQMVTRGFSYSIVRDLLK